MAEKHIQSLRTEIPSLFDIRDIPAGLEEHWERVPIEVVYSEKIWNDEPDGVFGRSWEEERIPPIPVQPDEFGGAFNPDAIYGIGLPPDTLPPPDCWAFYLPYHYFSDKWWGIYVLDTGVHGLTNLLLKCSGYKLSYPLSKEVALRFLHYHEMYHHATEAFATRLEVTHRNRLYIGGFQRLYSRTFMKNGCREEALANAYAFRHVEDLYRQHPQLAEILSTLRDYINRCPPGYNQALNYIHVNNFDEGQNEFSEDNHEECQLSARNLSAVWDMFQHNFDPLIRKNSRVNYLVPKGSRLAERLRLRLP